MPDMLVKLYDLPSRRDLKEKDFVIRRAMTPDKFKVVEWVREHMGVNAAAECDVCFSHHPVSCFIASRGAEIIGFACYNATAPDFFGPTMVLESEQGKGIGKDLLLECLYALRGEGYGYAVIGSVGPAAFYEKCVGAMLIPGSDPGLYKDCLFRMKDK